MESRDAPAEATPQDYGLSHRRLSPIERLRGSLSFGFGELLEDVGMWLVAGVLAAGVIVHFVPEGFIPENVGNPHLQMLSVLVLATPLYICATGSVPLAAALVMKGMSAGTALVLLMAGPATNIATLAVFLKFLGKRFVAVYLGTIVLFSYGFGLAFDWAFPNTQLAVSGVAPEAHRGALLASVTWWQWAASAVLALTLLRVFWIKSRNRWRRREGLQPYPQIAGGDATVLKVSGMSCEHCRNTVQRALMSVPGVESVRVSLQRGEAVISGKDFDGVELVRAVRKANYDAEVKASGGALGDEA